MQRDLRDLFVDQRGASEISDDQAVGSPFIDIIGRLKETLQLPVIELRVQRQVQLGAVRVKKPGGRRDFIAREIPGVVSGVEGLRAEINGIRTPLHRRVKRLGSPGRT